MPTEQQRQQWRKAKTKQRSDPDKKAKIAADRKRNREREYAWIAERKRDRKLWPKIMIPRLRSRAKKMGLEFNITEEDIPLPDVCPVFGFPLVIGDGNPYLEPDRASVDRFDNTKGYIKGNVRVISTRANILKKDATVEEIRALLRYMESVS